MSLLKMLMNQEDKEQLENKIKETFLTPEKFTMEIERIVSENSELNYIDAIIHYCEQKEVELETILKLITKPLKKKLEVPYFK